MNNKTKINIATRSTCILVVVLGIALHFVALHFSFQPVQKLTEPVIILFCIYMVLVPVVLFFLRGDRRWRLAVLVIWLLYAGLWTYASLTLD
jgi:hypothetical protein